MITALNGVELSNPEQNMKLMMELAGAEEFTVTVVGGNGEQKELTVRPQEP